MEKVESLYLDLTTKEEESDSYSKDNICSLIKKMAFHITRRFKHSSGRGN